MIWKSLGLAILAAFYGCYFVKMAVQRRKGIVTDQIGKGKTGFVKGIESALKVVTYLVPIVEVASILLGTTAFPGSIRMLGAVIGAVGVVIFAVSMATMRDSWRAGVSQTDKTELVTRGIYQFSRNPAFLGFDLVYVGILLMFFNWLLLAASALAMLMLHLQIVNVEEDHLIAAFGESYLTYQKQVYRYFGRRRQGK